MANAAGKGCAIILAGALLCGGQSPAGDKAQQIRKLILSSTAPGAFEAVIDAQINQVKPMMRQSVELALQKRGIKTMEGVDEAVDMVVAAFKKNMRLDELIERLVPIYGRHFSSEEIQGLSEFYASPLGRGFVERQAKMIPEIMQIAQTWGQDLIRQTMADTELRERLEAIVKQPANGTFTLESMPQGASVALNGKIAGTTPLTTPVEPGSVRVVMQKEGFAPWERTVPLLPGSTARIWAELSATPEDQPAAPPDEQGTFTGEVLRVGNGVTAPRVIYKLDPGYSDEARDAKWTGTAKLELVVDTAGRARNVKVIQSLGLGLDEKAVEAVSKWQFRPGTKDGKAVPVLAIVEVNFKL